MQQNSDSNIKKTDLYTLHCFKNEKVSYAKAFLKEKLKIHHLDTTIIYNEQVFTSSKGFTFPEHFLHIQKKYQTEKKIFFITQAFQMRLSQYLELKRNITQEQALKIFEQILKACYGLCKAGFTHRNLRLEHFVKVGEIWKLQSIVCQYQKKTDLSSEYLPDSEFMPPEILEKKKINEKQLNEKIVWDLGCILISLLTGGHKLKSAKILKQFQNQAFSFKKIKIRQFDGISNETRSYLSDMCHYNMKKRTKMTELFFNKYFSPIKTIENFKFPQKDENFVVKEENDIGYDQNEQNEDEEEYDQYFNIYSLPLEELIDSYNSSKKSTASQVEEKKKKYIELYENFKNNSKINGDENESVPFFNNSFLFVDVAEEDIDERVIDLYKAKIERCKILLIQSWKFRQIINFYKYIQNREKKGEQVALLVRYLVIFVSNMFLCELSNTQKFEKEFSVLLKKYGLQFHSFEQYKKTHDYKLQRDKIESLKKETKDNLKILKQNILLFPSKSSILTADEIGNFIDTKEPQTTEYSEIKQIYRFTLYNEVIKPLIDAFKKKKDSEKDKDWMQIAMHATYWISVDKIYRRKEMQQNFKQYFQWLREKPSYIVNYKKFMDYLHESEPQDLLANSEVILEKYFEFEMS